MFLRCSYFSGDFSLDVLIKGVLIKKKCSNETLVSTAETIPFAEDHDDVDVCSIPSTITITDENDDCDLQRHNANKKTWRNVIELRNHKMVRLTKFCDVNPLKDI